MAHMMTSSIIFSSAVRMPIFDHLTPVNSPSHYEIEHSFDYALTWKGNIFGNLEYGINTFRKHEMEIEKVECGINILQET